MSAPVQKRALLTLETKLKDIPRAWFHLGVEEKLIRKDTCWLWQGALDKDGQPVKNLMDPEKGKGGRRQFRLKRLIAEIFWEISKTTDIIQVCGNTNCLNPGHFRLSRAHWSHENRKKMVNEGQRNIKDYIRRKGLDETPTED